MIFDTAKKLTDIYEKFNEIKIRMDYVEKGTEKNIGEFKELIKDFDERLTKLERDLTLSKAELLGEMKSIKTLFESVYKKAIMDSVDSYTKKNLREDDSPLDNDGVKRIIGDTKE